MVQLLRRTQSAQRQVSSCVDTGRTQPSPGQARSGTSAALRNPLLARAASSASCTGLNVSDMQSASVVSWECTGLNASDMPSTSDNLEEAHASGVRITIVKAKGLRSSDAGGSSDLYCVCTVDRNEQMRFKTPDVQGSPHPAWNSAHEFAEFASDESLIFAVYGSDGQGDELLGKTILDYAQIFPSGFPEETGFNGELRLRDPVGNRTATLMVRVESSVACVTPERCPDRLSQAEAFTDSLCMPRQAVTYTASPAPPVPPISLDKLAHGSPGGAPRAPQDTRSSQGAKVTKDTVTKSKDDRAAAKATQQTRSQLAHQLHRAVGSDTRSAKENLSPAKPVAVRVSIVGAQDLANTNGSEVREVYCVCSLPGKKKMRFKTPVVPATRHPTFNFKHKFSEVGLGDALHFAVYEKDAVVDELLGNTVLEHEQFFPSGFDGGLELKHGEDEEFATLVVRVEIARPEHECRKSGEKGNPWPGRQSRWCSRHEMGDVANMQSKSLFAASRSPGKFLGKESSAEDQEIISSFLQQLGQGTDSPLLHSASAPHVSLHAPAKASLSKEEKLARRLDTMEQLRKELWRESEERAAERASAPQPKSSIVGDKEVRQRLYSGCARPGRKAHAAFNEELPAKKFSRSESNPDLLKWLALPKPNYELLATFEDEEKEEARRLARTVDMQHLDYLARPKDMVNTHTKRAPTPIVHTASVDRPSVKTPDGSSVIKPGQGHMADAAQCAQRQSASLQESGSPCTHPALSIAGGCEQSSAEYGALCDPDARQARRVQLRAMRAAKHPAEIQAPSEPNAFDRSPRCSADSDQHTVQVPVTWQSYSDRFGVQGLRWSQMGGYSWTQGLEM